MPRKNSTPAPDNAAFRERLLFCAKRVGTLNKLAIQTGRTQSTLRAYTLGSEPPRPILLEIARISNVSVSWLAAGSGTFEQESPTNPRPLDPLRLGFLRRQLDDLAQKNGGYDSLSTKTGLSIDALNQIQHDREPSLGELLLLCEKLVINVSTFFEPNFGLKAGMAFDKNVDGFATLNHGSFRRFGNFESLSAAYELASPLISNLIKSFPAETSFSRFELRDDTMEPTFKAGDVVIIKKTHVITRPGVYLFEGPKREFVTRVLFKSTDQILLDFDNKRYGGQAEQYNPKDHLCKGPVVAHFTIATLRPQPDQE